MAVLVTVGGYHMLASLTYIDIVAPQSDTSRNQDIVTFIRGLHT